MIVMTAGSATITTAVASVTSTIADVSGCCRCCHCYYCCLPLLLPLLLLLLRIRVLILAYPGNQNIVFLLLQLLLPLASMVTACYHMYVCQQRCPFLMKENHISAIGLGDSPHLKMVCL